jgi:hypothetical protein
MSRAFDASAIIDAWGDYPLSQFPQFWSWMGSEFGAGASCLCIVASDEVRDRDPDCHEWLREHCPRFETIDDRIIRRANAIKAQLGIDGEEYHPLGVGENDILIIAHAQVTNRRLVSHEARQPTLPQNTKKYKIPAVCALVGVTCERVRDVISACGQVFG